MYYPFLDYYITELTARLLENGGRYQARDNAITPTLNTPTVITPTLNTPTVITPTLITPTR
jgi:hypothetical protein